MNYDQALLSLKYVICSKIDGNWGAGDNHLIALEMLYQLDPSDKKIQELYEGLKKASERYDRLSSDPIFKAQHESEWQRLHEEMPSIPAYTREQLKPESIYRDSGKEEAQYYEKLLEEKYGEEAVTKINELYWDW